MKYDVHYFIKKFEAIPDEKIIELKLINGLGGRCANGWCGVNVDGGLTDESRALQQVASVLTVTEVNTSQPIIEYSVYSRKMAVINNGDSNEYRQPTPKQRILAALYDIRDMQDAVNQIKQIQMKSDLVTI